MTDTSIEWTEKTWNPVTGCSKVSPGCAHCYAEAVALRFWPTQYPPKLANCNGTVVSVDGSRPRQFTDVRCHEDRLDAPLHWKKPRRVFVNSMSDLFHEDVPFEFIDRVFAVMALAPQHTFQVLTKRGPRMREYVNSRTYGCCPTAEVYQSAYSVVEDNNAGRQIAEGPWPLPNVRLGVSVENQHFACERFPVLADLAAQGWLTMVSMEPLLERVIVSETYLTLGPRAWVIVGGESGPGARPFRVAWVRSIIHQCQSAGVPVFVKQLGANARANYYDERSEAAVEARGGEWPDPIGWDCLRDGQPPLSSDVLLPLRGKGGDPSEWPADLRVREFPT